MKRALVMVAMAVSVFAFSGVASATVVPDAIWVDGMLFGTVVTPTSLPDKGPFQPIYNFAGSSLSGQHSVATAGPGDKGFVGGRWEVLAATYTASGLAYFDSDSNGAVDPGKELMSWDALDSAIDAGYVTATDTGIRFVCTLNPQH